MSWLRRISMACLLGYWSLLAFATHLPGRAVPKIPTSDKFLHWVAFAGLAFLLTATAVGRRPRLKRVLLAILIGITYGAMDEWTQSFIPNRTSDIRDWYADVGGVLVGSAGYLVCFSGFLWLKRLLAVQRASASPTLVVRQGSLPPLRLGPEPD